MDLKLFYGIQIDVAKIEVQRIKSNYGLLTPALLLEEARNPKSVFHNCFTWDDDKAAHLFRMDQAKRLLQSINVTILTDGEPKKIEVSHLIKSKPQSKTTQIKLPIDAAETMRSRTIDDLLYIKQKLSKHERFNVVLKHIDNALSELELMEHKKQVAA